MSKEMCEKLSVLVFSSFFPKKEKCVWEILSAWWKGGWAWQVLRLPSKSPQVTDSGSHSGVFSWALFIVASLPWDSLSSLLPRPPLPVTCAANSEAHRASMLTLSLASSVSSQETASLFPDTRGSEVIIRPSHCLIPICLLNWDAFSPCADSQSTRQFYTRQSISSKRGM